GDIQAYNSIGGGWQTLARRCVDGVDAGTACGDTGGEWSGTASDITGGPNSLTPKIALNREGIAAVSFVRLRVSNCDQSLPLNDADDIPSNQFGNNLTTSLHVDCGDDRLYVNRFDGTSWLGTWDVTPRETLGARPPFGAFDGNFHLTEEANCWEWGSTSVVDASNQDGGVEDQFENSSCVDIGEPDVAIDASGSSTVSFKTWEWNQVHDGAGPRNTPSQGYLLASQHVVSVYAKSFDGAASWLPSSWIGANWLGTPAFLQGTAPLGQYRFSYDVTTAQELSTCEFNTPNDSSGFSDVMNCDMGAVTLAMEPDPADSDAGGPDDAVGSAFVAYERFNGTRRDIVAHRYVSGGTWGVPALDGTDTDVNDGGIADAE
ncbi:MAG TPA: hypothetical protein VLB09_08090, partial [Nitrospiria bacterium]|nr:hypothetical protein [Nitrospiria bacterium]